MIGIRSDDFAEEFAAGVYSRARRLTFPLLETTQRFASLNPNGRPQNGLRYVPLAVTALLLCCLCACHSSPIRQHDGTALVEQTATTDAGRAGAQLSHWVDRTPGTASPTLPAAGEDCAIIYDPVAHRLILYGGKDDHNVNRNEVWQLDLASSRWSQIQIKGPMPPPAEDHVAIYDPIGYRMLLHGGEDGLTRNALWAFDLRTHTWSDLTDDRAPAQEDHTAIYDSRRKRLVTYGGFNTETARITEMYAYYLDPASPAYGRWLQVQAFSVPPPGRMGHTAVYDSLNDRMVVFGGWDMEHRDFLGDTWVFRFESGNWRQIKTSRAHPPKRRHAVGVLDTKRNWLVIYGGHGERGYFNDVWAFDLTEDLWLNITPGPQPRIDHQAVYDTRSGSVLIYGGDAHMHGKFHDLWQLTIPPDFPLQSLRNAVMGIED